MTPDIERFRASTELLENQIEYLELELVDDPNWAEPSDTSYLNDDDRANPDIMSNVEAMEQTNALIAWFARDQEGFVGLWRGPEGTALDQAPVVRLDTEGQYEIVALTVGDYVAISVDEDDIGDAIHALRAAGFEVRDSQDAIWSSLDGVASPNDHRHELYNEARKARGLDPVE